MFLNDMNKVLKKFGVKYLDLICDFILNWYELNILAMQYIEYNRYVIEVKLFCFSILKTVHTYLRINRQ